MNLIEFILLAEPCRQASTPVVQRMNVATDDGGQRAHFAPAQHHRMLELSAGSGHFIQPGKLELQRLAEKNKCVDLA